MNKSRSAKQLAKFLAYVLGRRPDAFGLVPDAKGNVKIKELLKAVCEEDGWRHVRRSHINEILLTVAAPPVVVAEPFIRAADITGLPPREPAGQLPKLLYACVRQRAYPRVREKGVFPPSDRPVVLAQTAEMARRIGQRSDNDPVLLTVNVALCQENGVVFHTAGKRLFQAPFLPPAGFTGPPLPKTRPEGKAATEPPAEKRQPTPGSFVLDGSGKPGKDEPRGKKQRKKQIEWKKGRRQLKKMSRRR